MKKLSQHRRFFLSTLAAILTLSTSAAEVCNLKVVTDASPDYSDIPSYLHSVAAQWPTAKEKCWALFYWNHIARRQTAPMERHGLALTDPVRQFNDYGYTMCSTISGINCALWHNLGLPVKYWDITLHTVPEVFYDGRWHMYDNSMSALYTLCDGSTIAGVEDIGREAACAASGGRSERGHVAKYHCLYPWWDALKGEVQDKVEVLTSTDGKNYTSQGFLNTDLRWVDLPVNYMWPDDETITSATFRFVPTLPVMARYVKYQVTNKRIFDCAGLEVLDSIQSEPFDLRLALPDEGGPVKSLVPADDGS